MLSKSLYDLCLLISTPYENLNLLSKNLNLYTIDSSIIEEIYLRKLFNFKWKTKLNSSFNHFKFNYNYEILEQNAHFIKLKLNLLISFIVQNIDPNIFSACIHEHIIILEYLHNTFKIQALIENEEKPYLYNYVLKTDLSKINNFKFSYDQSLWTKKLFSIDSLYDTFLTSGFLYNNNKRTHNNFNISEACTYAETFALKPNPNYKYFDNIGGDCTNFISQILYAGGVKKTEDWKPYTNPWVRVEDIYLYLTKHNLATKLPSENSLSKGSLIQFYTPQIGRFFHNGFITYELKNGDYLYCCHSYNKLNYPLSNIYPIKYPTLRALTIH